VTVRRIAALVLIGVALLTLAPILTVAAAGPPFPEPVGGQLVYDDADALLDTTQSQAEGMAGSIRDAAGVALVVYTQRLDTTEISAADAQAHADALLAQWRADMVMLADLTPDGALGEVGLAVGERMAEHISAADLDTIRSDMAGWLESGDLDTAVVVGVSDVLIDVWDPGEAGGGATGGPAPGPPFPEPVDDQAVYDFAGILSSEAIVNAEATIDGIEARTGAEIVVYSQPVEYGVTTAETEARARALIDQWGIGRAGFDDGMVIFFDIDPSGEHGEVQLYAAPGFEATFLTNNERQSIFDNDMLPFLRNADFDGALGIALERIDDAATQENAARLETGRQVNAVLGLVGAPIVFLGLSGWAFFNWRRFGKDPVYLDDPSILMPAPPADLTAASGAFVMDGKTSRRALTTAMLDLASRGQISFREEKGFLGLSTKVGVDTEPSKGDDIEEARRRLNARRPTGPAEAVALQRLRGIDGSKKYIEPDDLPKFGAAVPAFDKALEGHVVERGWMVEKPSAVVNRWVVRGVVALVAGIVALILGANIPMSGLVLIGIAAIAGGVVVMLFAQGMPSVTIPGAMIRAMLAAYKRTLHKTMEQARSMQQVVDEAGLDWLVTPDQAVVWGTALGLQSDIEDVLKRSLSDVESGRAVASSTYFPAWYTNSDGSSFASAAAAGSGGSIFSGSAVPDLGGMMSALGTIGNSPSSSGGGGGGFGGGSSGGGGGGAGGGF
jgi:uncharacterized membrane protein YgcG